MAVSGRYVFIVKDKPALLLMFSKLLFLLARAVRR